MKQSLKIILGLALVAAGVLWILNILGVLNFDFSTRGWWTLFIIVPCLFGLFNNRDKVGPCLGIGVGVLLLLAARDVISWHMMWQMALALLVIGFGVNLILFKSCKAHAIYETKTICRDGKDIRYIESSFGRQAISFVGEKFEGVDAHSAFGSLTLDLNGADIADGAFIDLNVGFGGMTLIVPEGLAVAIAVSSGFGGVTDNRRTKVSSGTPCLTITGKVGFGGVEIRN
ncbi:MAG: cell wall-active antibiotics response protein [Bacteroidales bacterium]|nr:cell wall-active antibiotics response protein [Bacteroidales bacterium]